MRANRIDFTRGSMVRAIILFSLPIVAGDLLQNLYNSMDALIVGNFVNERALAAVTVGGVVSNLVINFFNGMSVGANVVISRAFGKGDPEELRRKIVHAFSFAVLLGVSLSILGILFTPQLLYLAGVQSDYYREALTYLRIYLGGLMFTVIYNNGAGVLRATGNSGTPFRILVVSCVVNIALDLLFTGGLRMGVAGVAWATVFSQGLSVALVYRAINRTAACRCLDFGEMLRRGRETIPDVLRVGVAAGLQSALQGFSNLFIVRYMNLFGTNAVAGIGIAQRLDKFVSLPAKAFGITMTTFISQNVGARRYERLRPGKWKCLATALTVTLSLSLVVYVFAPQCVRLFNREPEVISVGVAMMRVLVPTYWMMATREIYLGVLRGSGKNSVPMVLSILGMVVVRQLFLAVTMHRQVVIQNIFYCYPVAWGATAAMLIGYYLLIRKQLRGFGHPEDTLPAN